MTEIETTINEAIEGGWENRHYDDYKMEAFRVKHYQDCWIDPKFWQATCKTWKQPNTYKYTMIYFMSLLADGLTIEEALTKLR